MVCRDKAGIPVLGMQLAALLQPGLTRPVLDSGLVFKMQMPDVTGDAVPHTESFNKFLVTLRFRAAQMVIEMNNIKHNAMLGFKTKKLVKNKNRVRPAGDEKKGFMPSQKGKFLFGEFKIQEYCVIGECPSGPTKQSRDRAWIASLSLAMTEETFSGLAK